MLPPVEASRFVLHVSVALRWWDYDPIDPTYAAAKAFLEEALQLRHTGVLIVEGFEFLVLEQFAELLLGFAVEEFTSRPLYDGIAQTYTAMVDGAILEVVPRRPLARAAFVIATYHQLPFSDALHVVLAAWRDAALLVADERVYQRLAGVASARPGLRLVRVTDL